VSHSAEYAPAVIRALLIAVVLGAAAFRLTHALVTNDDVGFFEYVAGAVLVAALLYLALRARRSRPA
jgi:hypothetical protein